MRPESGRAESANRFSSLLKELRGLQDRLQRTVNHLWAIKLALETAYHHGHEAGDFLPRRLVVRERQEQIEFERLLYRLNRMVSTQFDSALISFSSYEDVKTVARISKTIRYIHNSFAGEPPLGATWARINSALPSYSKN